MEGERHADVGERGGAGARKHRATRRRLILDKAGKVAKQIGV